MKRFWAASICLVMAIGVIGWRPAAAVADELPPLVTVFDVSGSMNDQDSKGIVKLSTAKKSITDLLRAQPVNTPLGVWTYPGGSTVDGCSAGSWIGDLTPDDRPDITNVDAQIRKLSAGGNTPTGPALTAVTASLQSEGYTAATIVLVSDGESNCGPPPCEVARSVVEAGFDLTVAAVAFDIQTGDTNELQCVADVTGGTFTEADDSDALIDALSEYQARDLELEVKGPSRVLAGAHVTMTATVTNPSNNDVIGASLAVTFDDRSLVPYVPSPQYRLPTLPAGGTITRTWVVGTDSRYEGTTNWRILAGSTGAGSVMKTGQLVVTKQQLTRSDGGDVLADRGGTVVILGDSYSSGEGIGAYQDPADKCHRSELAYGYVAGGDQVTMYACSGALARQIARERQYAAEPPQLTQLKQLQAQGVTIDMVYLTIGGNDVGFGSIVEACFLGNCARDRETYLGEVENRGNHADLYKAISAEINKPAAVKARGGTLAPVIVSAYPDPFWEPTRGKCGGINNVSDVVAAYGTGVIKLFDGVVVDDVGFSPNEISLGKDILIKLNRQVEAGVDAARQAGHPVYYADAVADFGAGHTICQPDSYFVNLNPTSAVGATVFGDVNELFHPNEAGHRAWANALITWSQRTTFDASATVPASSPQWLDNTVQVVTQPIRTTSTQIATTLAPADSDGSFPIHEQTFQVTPAGTIDLQLSGLRPDTTVTIVVRSGAETLASLITDANGEATTTVTLPQLSSGTHTLTLTGHDQGYRFVGRQIPLEVDSGLPIGVLSVLALAAVAGIVLLTSEWKRRQATVRGSGSDAS